MHSTYSLSFWRLYCIFQFITYLSEGRKICYQIDREEKSALQKSPTTFTRLTYLLASLAVQHFQARTDIIVMDRGKII